MIRAVFICEGDRLAGFEITGHSMFAQEGSDIVCSAVSAMSQLVINTITDVFLEKAQVIVENEEEPEIFFKLDVSAGNASSELIRGFRMQLQEFEGLYPDNLRVII